VRHKHHTEGNRTSPVHITAKRQGEENIGARRGERQVGKLPPHLATFTHMNSDKEAHIREEIDRMRFILWCVTDGTMKYDLNELLKECVALIKEVRNA